MEYRDWVGQETAKRTLMTRESLEVKEEIGVECGFWVWTVGERNRLEVVDEDVVGFFDGECCYIVLSSSFGEDIFSPDEADTHKISTWIGAGSSTRAAAVVALESTVLVKTIRENQAANELVTNPTIQIAREEQWRESEAFITQVIAGCGILEYYCESLFHSFCNIRP